MTVTVHAGERGAPCEAWVHGANETVISMYRYKKGRWEYRRGFGEVWARCDRPGSQLPADVLRRIERA